MNDGTRKLFERVSKKMGWTGDDGLDVAEKKVCGLYSNLIAFVGNFLDSPPPAALDFVAD